MPRVELGEVYFPGTLPIKVRLLQIDAKLGVVLERFHLSGSKRHVAIVEHHSKLGIPVQLLLLVMQLVHQVSLLLGVRAELVHHLKLVVLHLGVLRLAMEVLGGLRVLSLLLGE